MDRTKFPTEVLKLIEKRSFDMIRSSILNGELKQLMPYYQVRVRAKEDWVADLVDSILEASEAVQTGFWYDGDLKDLLKVKMEMFQDTPLRAILRIDLPPEEARTLRIVWHGGELKREGENNEDEVLVMDGHKGFDMNIIEDAAERTVDKFIQRFEKDSDIKALIKKYTTAKPEEDEETAE